MGKRQALSVDYLKPAMDAIGNWPWKWIGHCQTFRCPAKDTIGISLIMPTTSGRTGRCAVRNDECAGRRRTRNRRSWFYLLFGSVLAGLVVHFALSNLPGPFANVHQEAASGTTPGTAACASTLAPSLSLRCISFHGHLYAVADIHLQSQEIVFTTSDDGRKETYPVVVGKLSRAGIKPILVTNAGIYGTDNRPLGLLISPKGKLHDVNTVTGAAHGNFSWDSAVFQISDDGTASIVSVRSWQDSRRTVAATQSGPQLASSGQINQSFQVQSKWSFSRTAIGVDQSNRKLVHLVVSRDVVTLFELASFMVNKLHCSEALHLDGDLSAFYIPGTPEQFLFSDPGERIVTVLSVIDKRDK
jgi:uncharacterized protein YigE (DUF2233 family)